MQDRWDVRKEGCMKAGMREQRDEGKEGCRKGDILEMSDANLVLVWPKGTAFFLFEVTVSFRFAC